MNTTSLSQRLTNTSYSVEEDSKFVIINRYAGDDGDYLTFYEAKETAIYLLELQKCELDDQINEISAAKTYEDLYFGGLALGTPDEQYRRDRDIEVGHLRIVAVGPAGDCCDEQGSAAES